MAETKNSAAVVRPPRLPLSDRTARALSFTGNTRIVYDSGPNRQLVSACALAKPARVGYSVTQPPAAASGA